MAVQLYVKNQTNQTLQLDIYDSDPIKITKAVEEVENVQATAGTFSRTFRMPQTLKNQQFFQGVFNVNSVSFDATAQATAWINSDGFFFTSGNIRLTNVYLNGRQNQVEFEILFMGETSDFSSAIGDGFLCELDFSEYSHDQTYANIRNSWDAATSATGGTGLFSGNVLYPLVEHGYTYDEAGVIIENSLTTGFTGSFTNSTKGLFQGQLKPALRADVIWRKIFTNAGYGFTGTFFDSSRWKALYMLSENQVRSIAEPDNTCYVYIQPIERQTGPYEISYFNKFPTIYNDPGSNVNIVSGYYTVSGTGTYTFTIDYFYETLTNNPSGAQIVWELFDVSNGVTLDTQTEGVANGSDMGTGTETFTLSLNTGQIVGIRAFFNSGGLHSNPLQNYMIIDNMEFRCVVAPTIVNPTSFMPCNFKKMDFMKSIIDRFKLVMEPSTEFANTFEITPWVDWIKQGDEYDWSQKLDASKDFKVSPLFYTQKRELEYNDQEDSDYPNYSYIQDNKKPYGQFKLDSGIKLIKDTQEIKGIFAPTPLVSIASATGGTAGLQFLIPSLAKDNAPTSSLGKREPIIPKPRLVFYDGKRTAPVTWYLKDDVNADQAQTVYPLVSTFESFPPAISTLDLHWQNDPYLFDDVTVGVTGRSANTVWNEYWEDWYNMYYSPYGRIGEGYFFIHDEDIAALKFNDKIFVENAWWNPTRIVDYEIGGGGVTKVQLVKIGDVNVFPGFTGATGATGGTGATGTTGGCVINCTQFSFCNNNAFPITYQYYDCDSGILVTQSLPPLVCQLLCACSTPYSNFENTSVFVQGICPGYTGATGTTGGSWGYVNDTPVPQFFSFVPSFEANPQVVEVQAYTSTSVCSGTALYNITGGTATLLAANCGGTGGDVNNDVFLTVISPVSNNNLLFNLSMKESENGVTYETVLFSQGFTGSSPIAFMSLQDVTVPNYFAQVTYTPTQATTPGFRQYLQLYVGPDLIRSEDVTLVPVGTPFDLSTPTPVNGIGYNFILLNIPQ